MIVPPPLALLQATCPAWFAIGLKSSSKIEGTATIVPDGAATGICLDLTIQSGPGRASIREREPRILPRSCPERHINGDGSFCLCYPAPEVSSIDDAKVWWGLLDQYIRLQRVAGRSGRWPVKQWLSHGAAGPFHLQALEAAKRLGIEEDYYRNLEGQELWFTAPFLRLDRTKTLLVNGRSPCPIGCMGRQGRPVLRRNCAHKEDVVVLVRAEVLRRKGEREFWAEKKREGVECCGTMKNCPLKDAK